MRLDPDEKIIADALDEAELDYANERGVGARIEFRREGHAKVIITISRELVERARAHDLTTGELFAEAIRIAAPGAFDIPARGGTDGLPPLAVTTISTEQMSYKTVGGHSLAFLYQLPMSWGTANKS